MIKMKSYLVLIVISFILLPSNFTENITKEVSFENTRLNLLNYPTNAVNHNPIFIDGNDELAVFIESEDLSGDGTYVSPYIIEDFTINASTADGIFINNTDVNLIIRDCTIDGGNHFDYYGIHLSNVTNVNISNNELIFNHRGFYLNYSSNNTISRNNVNNNAYGICLYNSSNNILSGNNANNTGWGIYLHYSSNNTISGNEAEYNSRGIYLHYSSNNTISGNEAEYNSRGIYLYYSSNNTISGNEAGYNNRGIVLYYSSNNFLSRNNANYNIFRGIYLRESTHNTFFGNNANNNDYGIYLRESTHNTFFGNNANINDDGIYLLESSNNTFSGNEANNNDDGIYLSESSNNTFSGNNANNNKYGIYLRESSNNTIYRNNANNNEYGIYLYYYCDNNTIYYNDIWGNQNHQAYEGYEYRDNHWDNGIIGNYWGNDYIIKNPDATNDGTVWNTPYEIDGDGDDLGIDHFPLVNSIFPDFEAPRFTNIPQDISASEAYSGLSIIWIIVDLYPATYTIELNGTKFVLTTAWSSGTVISYDIPDGLLENDYNITIIVSDESGNIAQDTVIFSVIHTSDFDEDGMPDSWEEQYNLNPLNASDAEDDPDGDGLTNLEEYLLGLNPRDRDTDNDGIPDNIDLFPNSFFMPTGLIITIFGSVGIIYAIFKIIKKERR